MWIAGIHNVLHLHHQLRIRRQPLFDLAAVEVFLGKVYIVGHALGEFLGRVGYQVFGGVIGDVQVLDDLVFLYRDLFPVQGFFYLFPGPALARVLDEEATANPGQRVRHVSRNDNAALHFVYGQLLLGHERALPHPQREDGHAQRIKVRLGGELDVGFIGNGDGVRVHLRGGINGGTELLGGTFSVLAQLIRNAKVAQDGGHFLPVLDEDVGRFDVLVQNAGLVQLVQGHGRIDDDGKDPFFVAFEAAVPYVPLRVVGHELVIIGIVHQLHRITLGKALDGRDGRLVGLEARVAEFEGVFPLAVRYQVQNPFRAAADDLLDGEAVFSHLDGFTGLIGFGAVLDGDASLCTKRRRRLLEGSGFLESGRFLEGGGYLRRRSCRFLRSGRRFLRGGRRLLRGGFCFLGIGH